MKLKELWQNLKQHQPSLGVLSTPCDQYGYCMGCNLCKPPHYLADSDDEVGVSSVFPYCVDCHVQLSTVEKVAIVDKLMGMHMMDNPHDHMEIAERFKIVRAEVEAGR